MIPGDNSTKHEWVIEMDGLCSYQLRLEMRHPTVIPLIFLHFCQNTGSLFFSLKAIQGVRLLKCKIRVSICIAYERQCIVVLLCLQK